MSQCPSHMSNPVALQSQKVKANSKVDSVLNYLITMSCRQVGVDI